MKLMTTTIALASTLLFSLSANAISGKTDAEYLAQCKSTIVEQLGEVERMKTLGIKSRRNAFQAKFRIINNDQRFVMECKVGKDQLASLQCASGDACTQSAVAAAPSK